MENPHGSERKSKGAKPGAYASKMFRDLEDLGGGAHHESNSATWTGGLQVDLLEIFHARQLRDAALSQLRRLNQQADHQSLDQRMRQHAIAGYYKALLLTSAELLQELGDDPHAT